MTRYIVTYTERYIIKADSKAEADEIARDHYAASPFAPVIPEEWHYKVEESNSFG